MNFIHSLFRRWLESMPHDLAAPKVALLPATMVLACAGTINRFSLTVF
jgi:hypothetical protein